MNYSKFGETLSVILIGSIISAVFITAFCLIFDIIVTFDVKVNRTKSKSKCGGEYSVYYEGEFIYCQSSKNAIISKLIDEHQHIRKLEIVPNYDTSVIELYIPDYRKYSVKQD